MEQEVIIKRLRDRDLQGGVCDKVIYPVTITSAVESRDINGNAIENVPLILEDRLKQMESKLTAIENIIEVIQNTLKQYDLAEITNEEIQEVTGIPLT